MTALDEHTLLIYTDGSSYSGPRRGGIGMLFVGVGEEGEEIVHEESPPGFLGATNNQMELKACTEALRLVAGRMPPMDTSRYRKVLVLSDSLYLVENFGNAKFFWPRNGWLTASGAPVENAPLWRELLKLVQQLQAIGKRVEIEWVQGKKSAPAKTVDRLAKQSARSASQPALSPTRLRRKKSPRPTEPGSVQMEGQRATIRIIGDEYLPVQRLLKYRYEVMSKTSPYYQCVDFIYGDLNQPLSRGHTYYVRFNDETDNPRIAKVFREVRPAEEPPPAPVA